MYKTQECLAIAIGNTRIQAAIFRDDRQILEEYSCLHDQLPTLERGERRVIFGVRPEDGNKHCDRLGGSPYNYLLA